MEEKQYNLAYIPMHGLGGIFLLTDRWCLLGGAYAMFLGKGITESPIVQHSIAMLVYFGASWLF